MNHAHKGKIISDWGLVNGTPEADAQFFGAMNYFMSCPDADPAVKAAVHTVALEGDFPANQKELLLKTLVTPGDYDVAYEEIFDIRDYTNSTASGEWENTAGNAS